MPSFPRLKTSLKPSLRSTTARSSASPTFEIVACFNRDGRRCSPFEALKLRVVQPTDRLDLSGRFGWLRLVPPHPGSPAGRGKQHPASWLSRASLPLAPSAPRGNAETPARPNAFDSPLNGERVPLLPRGGA